MAYVSKETKAKIAPLVKAIANKYGVKVTLAVRDYRVLVANISSGKIDFLGNTSRPDRNFGYIQVNQYFLANSFSGKALKFLEELRDALKSNGWYNNSNAQIDYFDTAWYIDINIGKWNKPYVFVK